MSGIRKVGDWDKVTRLIGALSKEMENARKVSLKRWGLKAEGLAKKHISNQDLGWEELSPTTLANKIRKGFSDNILVATSDYFQSITSWSDDQYAYAGVKKRATNSEGVEIADIAATHEFGSRSGNIPARPLWRPVMEETMEWYVNSDSRVDEIFMKNIKKYL